MARSHDALLRAKREYQARKRAADPEGARAYARQHHFKNHERILKKMRDYYARRFFWGRAMKLRGPGKATARDLARIWRSQRGLCALTGWPLDRTAQLDHVVAKARGGTDEPANLRWLCAAVNLARREFTDAQFIALCSAVVLRGGQRIQMVEDALREANAVAASTDTDSTRRVRGRKAS